MNLRQIYKSHCHTPVLRPFVRFGKALTRYYENRNYDHRSNGELRVCGRINIVSKALLHDFYGLLGGYGYTIGKVYPNAVSFSEYDYEMEDFIGPNFIAVRSGEKELIGRLK